MKKVLVGGSFDMLHCGHIELFNKAKSYGDYLIVMITSDNRIKFKKNPKLPIYSQEDRKTIIESLRMVDEVVIIDDAPQKNIALKALKMIKPDVYVRTSEVNRDTLAEELSICQELYIEMVVADRRPGSRWRSSSRIISYILDNFKKEDMEILIKNDETK